MKKLLIVALLATGISGFAQTKKADDNKDNKEMRYEKPSADQELKQLTSELKLTDKQQLKVKALLEEKSASQKEGEFKTESKETKSKEKPEGQKRDLKNEKPQNDFDLKLKNILTKEQYKIWESHKNKKKEEKKNK